MKPKGAVLDLTNSPSDNESLPDPLPIPIRAEGKRRRSDGAASTDGVQDDPQGQAVIAERKVCASTVLPPCRVCC